MRYSRFRSLQAEHNTQNRPERKRSSSLTQNNILMKTSGAFLNTHRQHGHPSSLSCDVEALRNVKLWQLDHEENTHLGLLKHKDVNQMFLKV